MIIRIAKPGKLCRNLFDKRYSQKPSLSRDEMKGVMRQFKCKSWELCKALGGGGSDNFLIKTSLGKKVLKRHHWSLPSTIHEHSLQRYLISNKFPCARMTLNKHGLSYSEYGGRYYALYDFIKGYCCSDYFIPPKMRQRLIADAAAKLADFHKLISNFLPHGRKLNGFTPDGARLWRDFRWHFGILDQYLKKSNKNENKNDGYFFLQSITREFKKLFIESDRYYQHADPQLPKLVVHGDYQPRNVFFDHHGVCGVLDFGDANLNLRVADVARGLKTFCSDRIYFINENQAQTFLHNYQEQIVLSEKELRAIPDLMIRRNLRNIIWSLHGELSRSKKNRRAPAYRMFKMRQKWDEALRIQQQKVELQNLFLSVGRR